MRLKQSQLQGVGVRNESSKSTEYPRDNNDLLKNGVSIITIVVSVFLNHHTNFSKEKEKGLKSYGRPQNRWSVLAEYS